MEERELPRRVRLDLMTLAEKAILEAIRQVEELGAHSLLTNAVTKLVEAQTLVAEYVDRIRKGPDALYPDDGLSMSGSDALKNHIDNLKDEGFLSKEAHEEISTSILNKSPNDYLIKNTAPKKPREPLKIEKVKPSVGRIVYIFPNSDQTKAKYGTGPIAGIVTEVFDEPNIISVTAFFTNGAKGGVFSVPDDPAAGAPYYWAWPARD